MSAKKRQAVLEACSVPLKKGGVNDDDETETETDTDSDEEPTPTLKGKGKGKASSNLTNGRLNPAVMLISLKVISSFSFRLYYLNLHRVALLG